MFTPTNFLEIIEYAKDVYIRFCRSQITPGLSSKAFGSVVRRPVSPCWSYV